MHIRVLGTVELAGSSEGLELRHSPRMRRLLALLVVGAGSVVSVNQLAHVLWGDQPPADPTSAVHNLVSRLRAIIRSSGCDHAVTVVTRPPGYLLDVADGELDCTRFTQLVDQARERLGETPQAAAALLDEALALWRGPAYAEFAEEEFAEAAAAQLEELRCSATADRIDAALALGRPDEAIGMLEPLLAAHPLQHRPRGQLMLALHRAGRSVEALETYRHYRDSLAEELGLDPPPELRELEEAILRHDRAVEQPRPARPSSNLPHQLTELIGRADDVTRVAEAIERARLVTLTGVGGVGKTRLALHVAAELAAGYPDGVWLCELAPVGNDAVANVLAGVLDVAQRQPATVTLALVDYLRAKQLLIVLDNCEHVTTAAAELADALMRGCPRVRVLATSREPLGAGGEQILPVAPLQIPDAVALFVQRATAASPSFGLTDQNAVHVAEVCRRLDGLPLALELVAPKVRSLSARDIVTRLDRRLQFVRTAGPDPGPWSKAIDRHLDDLRAAHLWSVQHEPDLAMRLTAALYWYVEAGSSSEVTLWAQRSVAVAAPAHPLLPLVLAVAAWGASKRGDLSGAIELAHRGLAAAADQDPVRRYALFVLGDVALFEGRLDEAVHCYDQMAHFAEAAGDTHGCAYAMANAALPLAYRSDEAGAVEAACRARSIAVTAGSPHVIGWADYVLGEALSGVDPGGAIIAVDAALATARDTRNRFLEGIALVSAASLQARHGDPRAALPLFGQVIDHWHRAGNWTQQWITLRNVIDLFARLGADEPAAILCGALGARPQRGSPVRSRRRPIGEHHGGPTRPPG